MRWTALLASALAPLAFASSLELSDAWVRALPPTQQATAAYLTAHNRGEEALSITGASADLAGRAELHNSVMVDGYMRMQALPTVTLAAGESLELAPGGKHLMLLDLERMPAAGESLQICLLVAGEEPACIDAPVRRGEAAEQHNHHQHH